MTSNQEARPFDTMTTAAPEVSYECVQTATSLKFFLIVLDISNGLC